jgi:hypothetical protein
VFDGELVDWSAKDGLDARQPDDGHRVTVWNREPGPPESGEFTQLANGFGFLADCARGSWLVATPTSRLAPPGRV